MLKVPLKVLSVAYRAKNQLLIGFYSIMSITYFTEWVDRRLDQADNIKVEMLSVLVNHYVISANRD